MENNFSLQDICDTALACNTRNIYIFAHEKHDGDAKGSSLALVEYFKDKGFNSNYIITTKDTCLLHVFNFEVEVTECVNERFIALILDTSTSSNIENSAYLQAEKIFRIDHHNNGEIYGDFNIVREDASSTCEIISTMLDENEITSKMATYRYIGMYTDTGGIKYNLSENVFLQLAKLAKCGADTTRVIENMRFSTRNRKRIEGLVALRNKVFDTRGLIGSIIKNESRFDPISVARAVSTLTCLKGNLYFCACESASTKEVYVEIQSAQSSSIDVSQYAMKYTGGGGHFHKAGFTLKSIDELDKVIEDLKGLL